VWITTPPDLGGLIREYEEELGPKTLYAVKEMMPCFG
jgi:hypothetical protein